MSEDLTVSHGMKCGLKSDCSHKFQFAPTEGGELMTYWAQCFYSYPINTNCVMNSETNKEQATRLYSYFDIHYANGGNDHTNDHIIDDSKVDDEDALSLFAYYN